MHGITNNCSGQCKNFWVVIQNKQLIHSYNKYAIIMYWIHMSGNKILHFDRKNVQPIQSELQSI